MSQLNCRKSIKLLHINMTSLDFHSPKSKNFPIKLTKYEYANTSLSLYPGKSKSNNKIINKIRSCTTPGISQSHSHSTNSSQTPAHRYGNGFSYSNLLLHIPHLDWDWNIIYLPPLDVRVFWSARALPNRDANYSRSIRDVLLFRSWSTYIGEFQCVDPSPFTADEFLHRYDSSFCDYLYFRSNMHSTTTE